jgi:hypothetical protein
MTQEWVQQSECNRKQMPMGVTRLGGRGNREVIFLEGGYRRLFLFLGGDCATVAAQLDRGQASTSSCREVEQGPREEGSPVLSTVHDDCQYYSSGNLEVLEDLQPCLNREHLLALQPASQRLQPV